jgi:hypothetical protein
MRQPGGARHLVRGMHAGNPAKTRRTPGTAPAAVRHGPGAPPRRSETEGYQPARCRSLCMWRAMNAE